jgi:hypothetical protein
MVMNAAPNGNRFVSYYRRFLLVFDEEFPKREAPA